MEKLLPDSDEGKRKVLIVEDDEPFRNLLGQIFEAENFIVRYAENGLVAKTILSLNTNKFDLVISDVHMPEMSGAELLKVVRGVNPNTKFIVMTGFTQMLDAKDALSLGANEFLAKPFKMKELLDTVEKVFKPKEEVENTGDENDEFSFCKIHVDEFTSASTLPSDIYIRLAGDKFVKVAKEGAEIQVERIQTYKEKKVEYFYVHVRDFPKYAGFTLRLAKAIAGSRKITREQKMKLYKHTAEILLTQTFIENIQPEVVDFSKNIMNNTLNLIGDEPDLMDLIIMLQSHSDSTYTHSVAVSVYSCLVAKKMLWTSQQTLLKLSLGGLFHDIGKKELSPHILMKTRREMTPTEIALYETHPQRGKEILSSMPGFPTDVAAIAFQHHENNLGTGYPLGVNQIRIHPLAKIVHLCDEFFHMAQKYKGQDDKPWMLAIKELWESRGTELDPLALRALMEIFNYPIPGPLLKLKQAS